jgi:hypothetical protein
MNAFIAMLAECSSFSGNVSKLRDVLGAEPFVGTK